MKSSKDVRDHVEECKQIIQESDYFELATIRVKMDVIKMEDSE